MTAELASSATRLLADRYQLRNVIGRGGAGTVWRAEDVVLRRQVAVKEVQLPLGLPGPERDLIRERVLREARAAAAVRHPALVTVFDVVESDGRPWIVLELVAAETLSACIQDRLLTPGEAARVGLALLAALEAIHGVGILHRDVKPGNVLMEAGGQPRLTDFGIAQTAGDPSLTTTGVLLGSPSYLPPERARGGHGGPASDLWGLGATLFAAVEGHPPFHGDHPLAVLTAVVEGRREPFVRAGALAPLLADLLDPEPANRPDAREIRQRLNDLTGGLESAERGSGTPDPADPDSAVPGSDAAGPDSGPDSGSESGSGPAPGVGPAHSPSGSAGTGILAPPMPPARRARRRRPLRLLAPALVAVVVLVAAALLIRGSGTRSPAPAAIRPAVSVPAATVTTGGAATLPAGWTRYADPAGWSVGYPATWRQTRLGPDGTDFIEPGTGSYLHVQSTTTPPPSALADWRAQEASLRTRVSDYAAVRIGPADGADGTRAADWEFTFGLAGSPLHALDRGLTANGTGYSLYWQTSAQRWTTSAPVLAQLLGSFVPKP